MNKLSKKILLTQGQEAIVDDEDFLLLSQYKWYAAKQKYTFYAERCERVNGRAMYHLMHRDILRLSYDDKRVVDHRDRNGLNNLKTNLRIVTKSLNGHNSRKYSNNLSGYRGVCWHKASKKWISAIKMDKKYVYLGVYESPQEAAMAYDKAALLYWRENAILNFEGNN
jgi:hypothetical protein